MDVKAVTPTRTTSSKQGRDSAPTLFVPRGVLQVVTSFTELLTTTDQQEQATLIDDMFATMTTFDDNLLMCTTRRGTQQLYWMFKQLWTTIEATLLAIDYHATVSYGAPIHAQVTLRYVVHATHRWRGILPLSLLLPNAITIKAAVTLDLNTQFKIVRQADSWLNWPWSAIRMPRLIRRLYGSMVAFTCEFLRSTCVGEQDSVLARVKANPTTALY